MTRSSGISEKKGVKIPYEWSEVMVAKGMVFNTTSAAAGFSSEALSGPRDSALYGKTGPFPFFLVPKCRSQVWRLSGNLPPFSKAPCSKPWAEEPLGEGHTLAMGQVNCKQRRQGGGPPALCRGTMSRTHACPVSTGP